MRQQRGLRGGNNVFNCNVFENAQAVGARHRHARLFAGADDGAVDGAAARQQDHHIAGRYAARRAGFFVGDARFAFWRKPAFDQAGNAARHLHGGIGACREIRRNAPAFRRLRLGLQHCRPQLDDAWQALADILMRRRNAVIGGEAAVMARVGENTVDGFKNGGGGAERILQLRRKKALPRIGETRAEMALHAGEFARLGALERIDRLFDIAHREHAAHHRARALPGGKIGRELFENLPLTRRRVLRLIDQNMIDAGIKFVQNPGGVGARQKRQRARDNVVEIEEAGALFQPLVMAKIIFEHRGQRQTALENAERAQLVGQGDNAAGFFFQQRDNFRMCGFQGLRWKFVARREFLRQIDVEVIRRRRFKIAARRSQLQPRGGFFLVGAALRQPLRKRQPFAARHAALGDLAPHAFKARAARQAEALGERGAQAGGRWKLAHSLQDRRPLLWRLLQQLIEFVPRSLSRKRREVLRQRLVRRRRRKACAARRAQKRRLLRALGLLKSRWHIGLKRKQMQHARAEGVDGLYLQPARRLDRSRKQHARQAQRFGVGARMAGLADRNAQRRVVERSPFRQGVKNAR